jgi:hypothetical protein
MSARPSVSPGADRADKARVSSRLSMSRADADMLGMTAMFCAAGLAVALLLATYGVDLIVGFF